MRNKLLLLFAVITAFSIMSANADEPSKKPVRIDYTQTGSNSENTDIPRAPMRVPSLYIEGHTLSFDEFYLGYTLQLVQDDQVVYTYQILTMDDLELPDTLSGEYEIQLAGPVYTFVGIVEL